MEKVTTRVAKKFYSELVDIQNKRVALNLDKKKRSIRALTELLVHHDKWKKIKEDMTKYEQ